MTLTVYRLKLRTRSVGPIDFLCARRDRVNWSSRDRRPHLVERPGKVLGLTWCARRAVFTHCLSRTLTRLSNMEFSCRMKLGQRAACGRTQHGRRIPGDASTPLLCLACDRPGAREDVHHYAPWKHVGARHCDGIFLCSRILEVIYTKYTMKPVLLLLLPPPARTLPSRQATSRGTRGIREEVSPTGEGARVLRCRCRGRA